MPLGASGSSIISATLFVPSGAPLQAKGGEIPIPSQVYPEGIRPPSWNTGLVRTMPVGNCVTVVADVAKTAPVTVVDRWDTTNGDKSPEPKIPTRTIPANTTTTIAKNHPLTIVTLRTKRNHGYIIPSRNIHVLRTIIIVVEHVLQAVFDLTEKMIIPHEWMSGLKTDTKRKHRHECEYCGITLHVSTQIGPECAKHPGRFPCNSHRPIEE
jgi:hypothetical protein